MKRFTDILVGVDLSAGDRFVCDELAPPTEEAVQRALWLAKLNSARLLFLYSQDVSAQTQRLIQENQGAEPTFADRAAVVLETLVQRARQQGIEADRQVVFGKSWVEIIRQVLRRKHDLVIAGTRHLGPVKGFLVGSTGIKLLRKCPCPVWITQPQPDRRITSILVAHGLTPVGDLAMELGCSMAKLHDAQLHVLHAAEYPELDSFLQPCVSAESAAEYRRKAEEHIAAQLGNFDLAQPAQVHFVTQPPDVAILHHVESHHVELLVMGTVARSGIPGLITGNTAERLLPQIPCSVLAVKPRGFKSPVTLDEKLT
jgi:universal stress protein E